MIPNIFDYATKELSQDAFIAWLIQWAAPENKIYDKELHLCGQEFVRQLIATQHQSNIQSITKVSIWTQWERIDVWAEIYTPDSNYVIIIEDKTFTTEHSNQLITYRKTGEDYCIENKFTLVCIYLKTGSEPVIVLNAIRSKGFSTFNRTDFIKLLIKYKTITNNIFTDFTNRLINLEAAHNAFETTSIKDWTDNCWVGFYQFLENEIEISWARVNNPNGGFWNAVLNWENWEGFPVYLQIEQGKLCFKISTHPEDIDIEYDFDRAEIRNEWYEIVKKKSIENNILEVRRPDRFGNGNYMTVCIVDRDNWFGDPNTVINKASVVANLIKYKNFLLKCIVN